MFSGHFGLAAGVKALDSTLLARGKANGTAQASASQQAVPLWALMLSTQLLDVVFAFLVLFKVEAFGGSSGYGEGVIQAYYSHSLVGALLIALVAGAFGWRWWGRQGGLLVGFTVFSHWLLDLLVHRADLPLLPGNAGNLPLLGFGLWNEPAISITLEAILIVAGAAWYIATLMARTSKSSEHPGNRNRALLAGGVTSLLLVLALVSSVIGLP
jgi:hypothetical protein